MASPKEDVSQPETEPTETVSEASTEFKSSAYGKALTLLKGNHQAEFDTILASIYSQAGFTYKRRLTAKERKVEQFKTLAAELGVEVNV
jgi:hypothetical protein